MEHVALSSTGGAKSNLNQIFKCDALLMSPINMFADLRYIQKSFEANISLLHFITVATLVCASLYISTPLFCFSLKVWMWTKRNSTHSGGVTGVLSLVLAIACYKVYSQ